MRKVMASLAVVVCGVLLGVGTGCSQDEHGAAQQQLQTLEQQVYNVPPKQMVQVAKQAVTGMGLPIESEQNGVIQTGWKEGYRGDWHIARYWQERTRYRIMVVPDINDPTGRSRVEVTNETETRSNDRAPWGSDPTLNLKRPERSADVIHAIQAQVMSGTTTKP